MDTVDEIIEAIGRAKLRGLLEVQDTAISNVKKRGKFAPKDFILIRDELKKLGHECPEKAFGFKSGEAA